MTTKSMTVNLWRERNTLHSDVMQSLPLDPARM